MGYDMLELDSLPREKGVLQARINEHRYQRRRARRRRIVAGMVAAGVVVACFVCWTQLRPLLAQLDVYQWIAVVAGSVFVASSGRLLRRRLRGVLVTRRSRPIDGESQAETAASDSLSP